MILNYNKIHILIIIILTSMMNKEVVIKIDNSQWKLLI